DAALWYVEALAAYVEATGDEGIVDELWPVLEEIVGRHLEGTRHGIGVDPADGLLRCGEAGVQLTWMDAIVDGWVVTPRAGKPVEINGLWLHALRLMAAWAPEHGADPAPYTTVADAAAAGLVRRFWDAGRGYLRCVVDTPDG